MSWFGSKKEQSKKENLISSKIDIFEKSREIAIEVSEIAKEVSSQKNKSLQMIHMSGKREDDQGSGSCLAVIGSPEGLCEMLYASGMKEPHMAKILISVGEKLSRSSLENSKFKEALVEDNSPCDCPECRIENNSKKNIGLDPNVFNGLNLEKIEKMTDSEMDEFVKKAIGKSRSN